jgi:hypothetical protein
MYMEDNRKRFLDKIIEWLVNDTVIDYKNRTWFPTFLDMGDYLATLRPLDISNLSLYPIIRFYDYCRKTYDLSVEEIEYLWSKYTIIIIDKFNNEKPLNESEDKLEKYFNYVIDDLIKRTKHWTNPSNRDHIGIIFPMYYEELEFYYTEDELKEWLHGGWLVGSEDIKYLMDQYGLTEDECSRVMDIYGIKLATLVLSKYGEE